MRIARLLLTGLLACGVTLQGLAGVLPMEAGCSMEHAGRAAHAMHAEMTMDMTGHAGHGMADTGGHADHAPADAPVHCSCLVGCHTASSMQPALSLAPSLMLVSAPVPDFVSQVIQSGAVTRHWRPPALS